MKTLSNYISEKLIINKDTVITDEKIKYNELKKIFDTLCNSSDVINYTSGSGRSAGDLLELIKAIFDEFPYKENEINYEYNEFIKEYINNKNLKSLDDVKIEKYCFYSNICGRYIYTEDFDSYIENILYESAITQKYILFNKEYTCYVYQDNLCYIIMFFNEKHLHIDGMIMIEFKEE